MSQPVVHFEIIGANPSRLHDFYSELFDWSFQIGDAATETVSAKGEYGFVDGASGDVLNGGVGGGEGYEPRVLFYVSVPNVAAALEKAESLGGRRVMGPEGDPGQIVVGHFRDPEGNLVGVAGTE